MSGNCATGMRSMPIRPAIAVTMAMTIARRGRSTKTAEIIGSALRLRGHGRSSRWCAHRGGVDGDAGADSLEPLGDDDVAIGEAGFDNRQRALVGAKLEAALLHLLLAIHEIHERALL